ncbi:unnamed protein product [Gordionus sp. m RMFG-2023]|uniref:splicing regulatory glutamine/lysine-rich protein 1-like isoform X2 n=1 Tax=Gordionus sp. m RMFG-2023 TaxID=3053472 RepID=UPI0030E52A4E
MTPETTNIIQVSNLSIQATQEQIVTLFGFLGAIDDYKLFSSEQPDSYLGIEDLTQVCYIKYKECVSAHIAQHLSSTLFLEKPLSVALYLREELPDTLDPDAVNENINSILAPSSSWPSHVVHKITGSGPTQLIHTIDPKLSNLGLPQYPPLSGVFEPSRIEEIRRTIYVGNLNSKISGEALLTFFDSNVGEVKYVRMAGDDSQPTRFAFVEFSNQESIPLALQYNGVLLADKPLKINHANNAIVKPNSKPPEIVQKEIERAMNKVKEVENLISSVLDTDDLKAKKRKKHSRDSRRRSSSSSSTSRSRSSRDRRRHKNSRRHGHRSGSRRRHRDDSGNRRRRTRERESSRQRRHNRRSEDKEESRRRYGRSNRTSKRRSSSSHKEKLRNDKKSQEKKHRSKSKEKVFKSGTSSKRHSSKSKPPSSSSRRDKDDSDKKKQTKVDVKGSDKKTSSTSKGHRGRDGGTPEVKHGADKERKTTKHDKARPEIEIIEIREESTKEKEKKTSRKSPDTFKNKFKEIKHSKADDKKQSKAHDEKHSKSDDKKRAKAEDNIKKIKTKDITRENSDDILSRPTSEERSEQLQNGNQLTQNGVSACEPEVDEKLSPKESVNDSPSSFSHDDGEEEPNISIQHQKSAKDPDTLNQTLMLKLQQIEKEMGILEAVKEQISNRDGRDSSVHSIESGAETAEKKKEHKKKKNKHKKSSKK